MTTKITAKIAQERDCTIYTYHEIEDLYEEYLNENFELINICGYSYDAGYALRKIDYIAFREDVLCWINNNYTEKWSNSNE